MHPEFRRRRLAAGIPLLLALGLGLGAPGSAQAKDPPGNLWVCAPSEKHCVEVERDRALTTVYTVVNGEKRDVNWRMYGAFPVVALVSGGELLVLGARGSAEMPERPTADTPMLYFIKEGKILGRVTLGDWYPEPGALTGKNAKGSWGRYLGLTQDETYGVELRDGRRIFYDPRTGEPVKATVMETIEERIEERMEERAGE